MSYKQAFVVLSTEGKAVAPYAVSAARALGIGITAAATVVDPVVASFVIPDVPSALIEEARAAALKAAEESLGAFARAAQGAGIAVERQVVEGMLDPAAREAARLARYADLVIVEQPAPDARSGEDVFVETLLFASGRPVLIVPYIQERPMQLERVLIAWDESAPAARAVAAALPLLQKAGRVEAMTVVSSGEESDAWKGSVLVRHLARHGVQAHSRLLTDVGDVAQTFLSHAADTGADLIVMGGYGHSRLRELVLGGATRGMLASMTVPTLMMH